MYDLVHISVLFMVDLAVFARRSRRASLGDITADRAEWTERTERTECGLTHGKVLAENRSAGHHASDVAPEVRSSILTEIESTIDHGKISKRTISTTLWSFTGQLETGLMGLELQ